MKSASTYAGLAEKAIEDGQGPLASVYAALAMASAQNAMVTTARTMAGFVERGVAIEEARQTPSPSVDA